jgi:hypothetical protein
MAVIREASAYRAWIPMCKSSTMLDRVGNSDQTFHFQLGFMGLLEWDVLMHGYGADCMIEDGSVLMLGRSIESSDRLPAADLPQPPAGRRGWRVELNDFTVRFKVRPGRLGRYALAMTPFSSDCGELDGCCCWWW